jgi:hypothetical protein
VKGTRKSRSTARVSRRDRGRSGGLATPAHPATFWLGYAALRRGLEPQGSRRAGSSAAFFRLFYGGGTVNMSRVYQLMSEQAQFWSDSWEPGPSSRKGLFGNSEGVFNPRRPVKDQTLPLPPAPGPGLKGRAPDGGWRSDNARRLQLAADAVADNDELLGLWKRICWAPSSTATTWSVSFNRADVPPEPGTAVGCGPHELARGVRAEGCGAGVRPRTQRNLWITRLGIAEKKSVNSATRLSATAAMVQELVAAGARSQRPGDSCMNSTT